MKRRSQPRIPGIKRLPSHTALLPAVERAVEHSARRFGASKSWVRATALAHYFGIDIETYHGGSTAYCKAKPRNPR